MGEIIFRKLEWKDIGQFIELRKQQLIEEGADVIVDLTNPLLDFYKRHFNDGTFVSWIATDNDEIIATSGMSFVEKPPYYSNPTGRIGILSSMYTVQSYRRKGIAKKLLGLIVNEARTNGCAVIQLTASDMGVPLYQNFGFEKNSNFFQYRLTN